MKKNPVLPIFLADSGIRTQKKFAFFHFTIIKKIQSMFWKDITVFRIFENYDLRFDLNFCTICYDCQCQFLNKTLKLGGE